MPAPNLSNWKLTAVNQGRHLFDCQGDASDVGQGTAINERKTCIMSDAGWHWRIRARLPLLLAGFWLSGCSAGDDDLPRQPVSGIVRLDGKNLARGTIVLYPDNHTKSFGSNPTGDVILNGRFSIPRRKGPTPGMYRISIFAERSRTERIQREANPESVGPRVETKIPAKFNAETVLEVEIKEGGIKELKIELTSR